MDMSLEEAAVREGFQVVCGVDEAGRGPLAGPVFAAAVILPPGTQIEGLNDSKKLTEKKREALVPVIQQRAAAYCVASASEQEIDELNILNATFLAMRRAVAGLCIPPDFILVDGDKAIREADKPCRAVIKGDSLSASIAAASVLAKVSRDHYMLELSGQYPQYAFEKHKGYGTKLHYECLRKYGVSPVHRKSFLRKFWQEDA